MLYTPNHQGIAMTVASVFINNRTQAVRLPADVRLPDSVKRVHVRVVGRERILTPVDGVWDSFFMNGPSVSDDFMVERASQEQSERESL
jgi:antitoxin VapB